MAKKPTEKKPRLILYVGGGGYLRGLPTRDMTIEEWEARPADLREAGLALELYQEDSGERAALDDWPEMIAEPLEDEETLAKDD